MPDLIPSLKDEEVQQVISMRDWLIFRLPKEEGKEQAVNRPDPHIDITLRESGEIRIGIRCNTIKSVEKLMNILDGYHQKEKVQLVERLRPLDDRFVALIINRKRRLQLRSGSDRSTKRKALQYRSTAPTQSYFLSSTTASPKPLPSFPHPLRQMICAPRFVSQCSFKTTVC